MTGMSVEAQAFEEVKARRLVGLGPSQYRFKVLMGTKGASRILERWYETKEEAVDRARRWGMSNGTGEYWAKVRFDGRVIYRMNLVGDWGRGFGLSEEV